MIFDYFCQTSLFKMPGIGELIRSLRLEKGLPLRKVAAFLDIDQAVLSKIERGQRKLTEEQVLKLAGFFNYSEKKMLVAYLSDRIYNEIRNSKYALDALKVAEQQIEYRSHTETDRRQIRYRITQTLKKHPKIKSAHIYGSFSREDDDPGSDIDIALVTDPEFSYFDLAELQYRLEQATGRRCDVGFLDGFKQDILENVKPDLKVIYERPEKKRS